MYDRINAKQLQQDNLPIRKHAPSYTIYYDKPQRNIKRCKIVVDSWDNGKILSNMAHSHKAQKEVSIYYYLDIKNNEVRKLKEVVRYYNKHNLAIDTNLVYKGTKSQATRKLNKLLEN